MQRSESAIGKIIDGYKILDLLGQGGMGIVYKAEDIALSRIVALKMIAPDLASQESFLRRFQSEARALARVDSPYIVGVHTLRKSGQHVFIVMEYVDGWTLSDEMNKGMLERMRAFSILKQLLQAFSHAHGVGVIHRDIKPSNIMLTREGRVKVTDFGLAKLRREDGMSTVTQGIAGTARYMSPEQVQGKKIDHRSDIYSLGMTLYHMFAGKLPFEPEEGTYSILRRVVEEDFPRVSELNQSISPAISDVISRALAKEPEDRFQSADDMLAAVEKIIQQSENKAPERIPVRPQTQRLKTGKRLMYTLLTLGIILVIPAYFFFSGSNERDFAEQGPITRESAIEATPDTARQNIDADVAFLKVESTPTEARVLANGQRIGITPLTFELAPGEFNLTIRKQGYISQEKTVTLAAGDSEFYFELKAEPPAIVDSDPQPPVTQPEAEVSMVQMRLNTRPGGTIFVNGAPLGEQGERMWPAGEYMLRFVNSENPELTCEKSVVLSPESPVDLTCYFEHELTIITASERGGVAPYANLFINGEGMDTTPLADHVVSSGTYTIELRRFGHVIENPIRTIVLSPTFEQEKTFHKETFIIKAE